MADPNTKAVAHSDRPHVNSYTIAGRTLKNSERTMQAQQRFLKNYHAIAIKIVAPHVKQRFTGERFGRRYTPASSSTVTSSATGATQPTEYCVIVDMNNQVVGAEPRDVTVRNRLLGRGSYVLVTNSQGELLVSKRSSRKDVYPGHWDVVIAGVVRAGEEYEDTAARELAEEIGVSEDAARAGLRRLFVFPYRDSSCHVWGCAFTFTHGGGRLQLQEEEVDWAGFRSWEQVLRMLQEERFTPVGKHILRLYDQQQQQQQ